MRSGHGPPVGRGRLGGGSSNSPGQLPPRPRLLPPRSLAPPASVRRCLGGALALAPHSLSHTSTVLSNSSSVVGPRGSVGYIAPEYGMGCEISIEGDVYSYGIILLEMITGKRPTDEIFKDGSNLHSLVKLALPQKIGDILEPSLIICHEDEDANCAMGEMQSCVIQLATLGLKCSAMSPKDRPTIQYVHAEMVTIKERFSALHN